MQATSCGLMLWTDEILHHIESMGDHCLLPVTWGIIITLGFLGGAGFRSSTVGGGCPKREVADTWNGTLRPSTV